MTEYHTKFKFIYKVFCPEHRPFDLEHKIHSRRAQSREEIRKFAHTISKYNPEYRNLKLSSSTISKIKTNRHGSASKREEKRAIQKESQRKMVESGNRHRHIKDRRRNL